LTNSEVIELVKILQGFEFQTNEDLQIAIVILVTVMATFHSTPNPDAFDSPRANLNPTREFVVEIIEVTKRDWTLSPLRGALSLSLSLFLYA